MIQTMPCLLFSLILEKGEKSHDTLAILAPDQKPTTYHQLAVHITSIAQQLNRWGFRHTDRVAVILPNGPNMLTAFLSVSTVCACAPINPGYQVDEFVFSMTDLHAKAVIVQRGMTPLAREAASG